LKFFQHAFPHERSDLSHWRKRLGEKLELLLAESLGVALRSNLNALRQPQPRRGHHYVSCNQQNLSQPNAKQWVKLRRMPLAWNSGDAYEFAELGEVATVDRLLQDLAVVERLDALIDKCLKRLLFLRGLKSLPTASSSAPPQPMAEPHCPRWYTEETLYRCMVLCY
jgi:hypothetical protein